MMTRPSLTLRDFARIGFASLSTVRPRLDRATSLTGIDVSEFLEMFSDVADPDGALTRLIALAEKHPSAVCMVLRDRTSTKRFLRVLGASAGFCEFFLRNPRALSVLTETRGGLPQAAEFTEALLASVNVHGAFAAKIDEETAWSALRIEYRLQLVRIAVYDLGHPEPESILDDVAARLADLAGAALEASLAVARTLACDETPGPGGFPRADIEETRFAIIGMGKAGANELNYVSDVDVIFVADKEEESHLSGAKVIDIATRLAVLTMRGVSATAHEPSLWEVDTDLRPEGKDGALVRTPRSHIVYYERWAQSWEFQALLKARPLAGDRALGESYVDAVAPKVWESASRENFVDSVQRMRERVTDNIPADEISHQLKLGHGGIRDIEFTVQLLQLVHGVSDLSLRVRATLPALKALADGGYIGRTESAEFAHDYRVLRLLEHRLQLHHLRRTHLMPRDEEALRTLARATRLASTADGLTTVWERVKRRVNGLHQRLFYQPLLSAVAALPAEEQNLSSTQAEARLAAIGFRDPPGALRHIAALTTGLSRRAIILQNLLPVMLQWFADGADPDYGLLAFRRLSEALAESPWYVRMLRDSSGAAFRLTRILSGSRFVGELLDLLPEAVAWLEDDSELRPRSPKLLSDETNAILARHDDAQTAATALRFVRRRELLRLAISNILGLTSLNELSSALTHITESHIRGLLAVIRRHMSLGLAAYEFAVIAMGRFGGREIGFGSDADVLYVFRPRTVTADVAAASAKFVANELNRLSEDARLPLELDLDLRPEGKNGPTARSLDSYAAYYGRWSLTWEAQALLRARGIAGDVSLIADFERLADTVRFPATVTEQAVREVKRIKARIETERLPRGADPTRHVKLGRGSLSDVEWFVQLVQLQFGHDVAALRTPSTLAALRNAHAAGFVTDEDFSPLEAAWIFASRTRSAMTLYSNKTVDVLPIDRRELDGIARLMTYSPRCATTFEEDYLRLTRRARSIFERHFYGETESPYR